MDGAYIPVSDLRIPILAFLSALAQNEREWIVKRAQDGRNAAEARRTARPET